ncbi:MAG: ribosome assembly cofactor RimP [Bacteroidales bacterium]|nr:ribosome assembly cofactor RimP [Bacteroidales bacterium]
MISAQNIQQLIESQPELQKFFIVDIKVSKDNVITIKADTDSGITIDECGELSHAIEDKLDREQEDFELEVSSPGLTEPLRILRQYQKNMGKEVEVLMVDGEKVKGTIAQASDATLTINTVVTEKQNGKKVKVTVPQVLNFCDIKMTKLKITFK